MKFICTRLLFLLLISSSNCLSAQALSDSAFISRISERMVGRYLEHLNSEAPLYNGKVYLPTVKLDENGHAMFISRQFVKGSITTSEGYVYQDVDLMYDLIRDQLVLLNRIGDGGIVIWPRKVRSFSLHDHSFVYICPDSAEQRNIDEGYYDLLYRGSVELLVKRKKDINETTDQDRVKRTVSQRNRYFLVKRNSPAVVIKSKKDLLKLLRSTHEQNLKYIKAERLNFKKDRERAIIRLLKFHDSIS